MLDRLLGLETEYAIRFSPEEGSARPDNARVYAAIAFAVERLVHTAPGDRHWWRKQFFVENGGSIYYESLPYADEDGLLEGGTPECRGPGQLLLYQKAQDALLLEALDIARIELARQGYLGELGLLKNCRDGEGNLYGAQENYEVEMARGAALGLYRLGLLALTPLIVVTTLMVWSFALLLGLGLVVSMALVALFAQLVPALRRTKLARALDDPDNGEMKNSLGRLSARYESALWWPVLTSLSVLLRLFAFRRVRRDLLGFLCSRAIVSGAGTLGEDGHFLLAEKAPWVKRVMRNSVDPADRAIFDVGNLFKLAMLPAMLRPMALRQLFARRARMQLGLSDSNLAQVAEFLKFGTTALCIDMSEAGALDDAPRPKRPVASLVALVRDPTMKVKIALRGGGEMSALELQRWYLERATQFVKGAPAVSLEAREIVRLWGEVLGALERDPSELVGRIDWVTKRYFLETAGAGASDAALKKIDLRYHELGTGYFARLEALGQAPQLVVEDEVQDAIHNAPADTPARLRGHLIREIAISERRAVVSWDSVRIQGGLRAEVIRLDTWRRDRPERVDVRDHGDEP